MHPYEFKEVKKCLVVLPYTDHVSWGSLQLPVRVYDATKMCADASALEKSKQPHT
jgi:hypothetical protein